MRRVEFRIVLIAAISLAALALAARPAHACSTGCTRPSVHPADEGSMPASAEGLLWKPSRGLDDPMVTASDVELVRITPGKNEQIPVSLEARGNQRWFVRPSTSLRPGARYRFTGKSFCSSNLRTPAKATFQVTEPVAPPQSAGKLRVTSPMRGRIKVAHDALCWTEAEAVWVDVEVELSSEAKPWRDMLLWSTRVDDETWSRWGGVVSPPSADTTSGRGEARIYALCGDEETARGHPGAGEGSHTVRMRGRLPWGNTVVKTDAKTIQLDCTPPAADADTTRMPDSATADGGTPQNLPGNGQCNSVVTGKAGFNYTVSTLALVVIVGFLRRRSRRFS